MLTLLFVIWLLAMTFKLAAFGLKVGWGLLKMVLFVAFLPLMILGLLISGIITLTVPVLVIIGFVTMVKLLIGRRA